MGCESTFNWHWLDDTSEEKKIPFLLGHALYLKAIHGGKVKSDKIDSENTCQATARRQLCRQLRLPQTLASHSDLLRRRGHFVSRRGETLAHLQIVNHQQNLPAFPKKLKQSGHDDYLSREAVRRRLCPGFATARGSDFVRAELRKGHVNVIGALKRVYNWEAKAISCRLSERRGFQAVDR